MRRSLNIGVVGLLLAVSFVTFGAGQQEGDLPVTVTILGPEMGATVSEPYVLVYGRVENLASLQDIRILIYTSQIRVETDVNVDGYFRIDVPLVEGHNTITLYAIDAAGNMSNVTSVTVKCTVPEPQQPLAPQGAEDILTSIDHLPDNRIRATLRWSTYIMYAETSSSVLGVKFDSTNKQLYIEVGGQSGTSGELYLMVSRELVPSTDEVKVSLDGNPIDFTLTQVENDYRIHVEYTHSTHTLTVNLIALPAWYTQPLNLVLLALAVVVVLGAIYWRKFRR
jgi:hypothetical protein